jgi:hypothetical protein
MTKFRITRPDGVRKIGADYRAVSDFMGPPSNENSNRIVGDIYPSSDASIDTEIDMARDPTPQALQKMDRLGYRCEKV